MKNCTAYRLLDEWLIARGLSLIELLPCNGARLVARVENSLGGASIVKILDPELVVSAYEGVALGRFHQRGAVEIIEEDADNDVLWLWMVEGECLIDRPDRGLCVADDIGRLARSLHKAPYHGLPALGDHLTRVQNTLLGGDQLVSSSLEQAARAACQKLINLQADTVCLHGDFSTSNLIAADATVVAIDPYGLAGPACYDIAYYATNSESDNIQQLLAGMMRGYASSLPGLESALTWTAVIYLAYRRSIQADCSRIEALLSAHVQ